MGRPVNLRELVDVIRRSRLIDDQRLAGILQTARVGEPDAPSADALLTRLIGDGTLTRFQAEQLAAGRWKGFAIGSYKLLDKLGSGGMGRVFLAEHAVLGKRVAIKVLEGKLAADPVARQRFTLEARAAAALDHPNIVHVIDLEADAEPPYIVMEYVDGVTLQAAVQKSGPLSPGTAAYCARQVALALQLAYEVGLVHRDIKPANLLIDRRGLVKVLDLGIVRIPGESLTMSQDNRPILGTADYLAPEQAIDSSNVDTRADIYALGATLYYTLAGQPPYADGSAALKIARKQVADPPWIGRLRPDIPEQLANVVHRMMARSPADRYPTPNLAAEALAPWAVPDSGFPANLLPAKRAIDANPFFPGPPSPYTPAGAIPPTGLTGENGPLSSQTFPADPGTHPGTNGTANGHYGNEFAPPGSGYHTPATNGFAPPATGAWPSAPTGTGTWPNVPAAAMLAPVSGGYRAYPVAVPAPPPAYPGDPAASTVEVKVTQITRNPTDITAEYEVAPAARPRPPERRADNTAMWLAIGGVGVAVAAAAVAGVLMFGPGSAPTANTKEPAAPASRPKTGPEVPRTVLAVTRKPGDTPHMYPTVRDAIRAADRSRSRIEIWDDNWEELLTTAGTFVPPDITITGKQGGPVKWRGPAVGPLPTPLPGQPPPQHPPLVLIHAASGITFENVEFDGGNSYHVALHLAGDGYTLRNVIVRGFLQSGFVLAGTTPTGGPNLVEKCRLGMAPNQASAAGAIRLTGGGNVRVTQCRVEGLFGSCVAIEAPMPNVQIDANRFQGVPPPQFGMVRGVSVAATAVPPPPPPPTPDVPAPPTPPPLTLSVTRNVFADLYAGVHFAALPTTTPANGIDISGNLFDRVQVLGVTDSGLQFDGTPGRRWVWDGQFDPSVENPVQPRGFRGTFDLPAIPAGKPPRVCVDLACSGVYSLWVNGKPVVADRYTGFTGDAVDVTDFVRAGPNAVAVKVVHWSAPEHGNTTGDANNLLLRPGWAGSVRIPGAPGTPATHQAVTAAAGKLWKVKAKPDDGWWAADFNDAGWQNVADVLLPPFPNNPNLVRPPYNPPIFQGWASRADNARPGVLGMFKPPTGNVAAVTPGQVVPMEIFPPVRAARVFFKEPLPRNAADDATFLRHRDADVPERFRKTFGLPRD